VITTEKFVIASAVFSPGKVECAMVLSVLARDFDIHADRSQSKSRGAGRPLEPLRGERDMADVNRGNRPLSPFMLGKHYRLQLTSLTSILTRITGAGLLVGALLVVWWLMAAAAGPASFALADGVITSWFGKIVMLGSIWALWYHTLAGVRHLIWDMGYMLDIRDAENLGRAVIAGSVLLTVMTVLVL